MFQNIKHDIPDFLYEDIIWCDRLVLSRKQRSCLTLLRNLKFYEFRGKVALKCMDLKATCLEKIQHQLMNFDGNIGCEEVDISSQRRQTPQHFDSNSISFGKYIYQNFEFRKMFLLIKCWDKLIVLLYDENTDNLELIAEYEEVSTYKLVYGRIKFQASVEIKYLDGRVHTTNFHDDNKTSTASTETVYNSTKCENFKPLLERIRSAKTELFVHKSITQQDYNRLKNTQTFGCNFLRSQNIEEKQMLAKCGDLWMRFTTNDYLVIGVPLVNNASKETYTILSNFRPIFKSSEKHTVSYTFRLYQHHQCFKDLETLETFFQCEEKTEILEDIWSAAEDTQMLPESFAVLCIRLYISEIISLQRTPLFIFFDIDRDVSSMTKKTRIFNQQVFIANLDVNYLVTKRALFEITFQKSFMHQDFLAVAMTSSETELTIAFQSEADLEKFEQLLSQRFNFVKVNRHRDVKENANVEIVNASTNNLKHISHILYYNHTRTCIWYNTLVVRYAGENVNPSGINTKWKFYTNSEEKSFLMLKFILNELILLNCNVSGIACPDRNNSWNKNIIELENALRNELNYILQQCGEPSPKTRSKKEEAWSSILEHMLRLELNTDLSAKSFLKPQ